jgi:hypothetical protein
MCGDFFETISFEKNNTNEKKKIAQSGKKKHFYDLYILKKTHTQVFSINI